MRALAALWLCSFESKLSLPCPLAAVPVLRPGALASSSKNNVSLHYTQKQFIAGCFQVLYWLYTIGHVFFSGALFFKYEARGWSFSGSSLLWLWQWFQRNRYQLAHCAKASFQAQGRKMRTLTEGHWQNQSVLENSSTGSIFQRKFFIVFVLKL